MTEGLVVAALSLAAGVAAIRWLRVAQREHYLAGAATRFSWRWWSATPTAVGLGVVGVAATLATVWWTVAGLGVALVVAVAPPGLTLRGRTSPLAWTARLRRVAIGVGIAATAAAVLGLALHPVVPAIVALCLPVVVDGVLAVLAPVEHRLGAPWVKKASAALRSSRVTVVAITGSYGKTTTKGYIVHLLASTRSVLASPASFNNRMGLARAINEHLSDGVDVFLAEMGTYGPGEIADLCSWIPPDIAVITAIGPVHLERFGTEDKIAAAKSEILAAAPIAVLNVDDPRLARLAETERSRRRVIRVGSAGGEDVTVDPDGAVALGGEPLGVVPGHVMGTNLACALGVVVALGVDPRLVAGRLATLTEPDHRGTPAVGASGVRIIDDTFNSNPAGVRAALSTLAALEVGGRRVLVTPGMVELGPLQAESNRLFAAEAGEVADRIMVIGRTNRAALVAGASGGRVEVVTVDTRDEAVAWVRANLGPADAVLYENDLPDHYP